MNKELNKEQWTIIKEIEIAISHKLDLDYISKCNELHGHNLKIKVFIKNIELDENNMVYDFKKIKEKIENKLDHKHLNNIFTDIKNITVEFLSKWICEQIDNCYKVEITESPTSSAIYERLI